MGLHSPQAHLLRLSKKPLQSPRQLLLQASTTSLAWRVPLEGEPTLKTRFLNVPEEAALGTHAASTEAGKCRVPCWPSPQPGKSAAS